MVGENAIDESLRSSDWTGRPSDHPQPSRCGVPAGRLQHQKSGRPHRITSALRMRRAVDSGGRAPCRARLASHCAAGRGLLAARRRIPHTVALQSELRGSASARLRLHSGARDIAQLERVRAVHPRRMEYCDANPDRQRDRARPANATLAQDSWNPAYQPTVRVGMCRDGVVQPQVESVYGDDSAIRRGRTAGPACVRGCLHHSRAHRDRSYETTRSRSRAPQPWWVFLATAAMAILFMIAEPLARDRGMAPFVSVIVRVACEATAAALIVRWSRMGEWGPRHYLALSAGTVFTYGLFGLSAFLQGHTNLGVPTDRVDVVGQLVLISAVFLLIWWGNRRSGLVAQSTTSSTSSAPA